MEFNASEEGIVEKLSPVFLIRESKRILCSVGVSFHGEQDLREVSDEGSGIYERLAEDGRHVRTHEGRQDGGHPRRERHLPCGGKREREGLPRAFESGRAVLCFVRRS